MNLQYIKPTAELLSGRSWNWIEKFWSDIQKVIDNLKGEKAFTSRPSVILMMKNIIFEIMKQYIV